MESYVHDANDNVVSQTVKGVATSFSYDRNRLRSATTAGVGSAYNYDPFGRLDTVFTAGSLTARYSYDGFDRIAERFVTGAAGTTRYVHDPLDRTVSRTDKAGTAGEKTTSFAYLGLSDQVVAEQVGGRTTKTYQYALGRRVSQTAVAADGAKTDGFFGYNPHTDVETITGTSGDTRSTYGYTAYGAEDTAQFTGADKPGTAPADAEPASAYRFNGMRLDPGSGDYDMGSGPTRRASTGSSPGTPTTGPCPIWVWPRIRRRAAGGGPWHPPGRAARHHPLQRTPEAHRRQWHPRLRRVTPTVHTFTAGTQTWRR